MFIFISYLLLGFISFLLILLLKNKFNITKIQSFIFSLFFILIYASIFSGIKKYIFVNLIFQFLYDFIYITYILEEDFFDKTNKYTSYYIFLIVIGLIINNTYINKVEQVFLTGEDIRLILWFLIILFLYKFIKDNKIFESTNSSSINTDYIINSYTKLRKRYLDDIDIKDKNLELIIYSIMIFNNRKRNNLLRSIDNIIFKYNNKKRKLSIMQIETNNYITDIDGINIVTKDIKKIIGKKKSDNNYIEAINKYCDNEEIITIFNTLKNFFKI